KRLFDPVRRLRMPAVLVREHAQVVQGLRVPGLGLQDLAVKLLGLVEFACLVVPQGQGKRLGNRRHGGLRGKELLWIVADGNMRIVFVCWSRWNGRSLTVCCPRKSVNCHSWFPLLLSSWDEFNPE